MWNYEVHFYIYIIYKYNKRVRQVKIFEILQSIAWMTALALSQAASRGSSVLEGSFPTYAQHLLAACFPLLAPLSNPSTTLSAGFRSSRHGTPSFSSSVKLYSPCTVCPKRHVTLQKMEGRIHMAMDPVLQCFVTCKLLLKE